MNETLRALLWVLLLPAAVVSFTALEVVLWLLVPGPLAATGEAMARGRGRCLFIGLAAIGVGLVLVSALSHRGQVADMLAAAVLGLMALGGLTGISAVTALLGKGALKMAGRPGSRAANVVVGSLLFCGAGLFPIVGWVLAVYFLLIGLGGALLALVSPRRGE